METNKYKDFAEFDISEEIVLPDIGTVFLTDGCTECDKRCMESESSSTKAMKKALDDICISVITQKDVLERNCGSNMGVVRNALSLKSEVDGIVFLMHDNCEKDIKTIKELKEKITDIPVIEVTETSNKEKTAKEDIRPLIFG